MQKTSRNHPGQLDFRVFVSNDDGRNSECGGDFNLLTNTKTGLIGHENQKISSENTLPVTGINYFGLNIRVKKRVRRHAWLIYVDLKVLAHTRNGTRLKRNRLTRIVWNACQRRRHITVQRRYRRLREALSDSFDLLNHFVDTCWPAGRVLFQKRFSKLQQRLDWLRLVSQTLVNPGFFVSYHGHKLGELLLLVKYR